MHGGYVWEEKKSHVYRAFSQKRFRSPLKLQYAEEEARTVYPPIAIIWNFGCFGCVYIAA